MNKLLNKNLGNALTSLQDALKIYKRTLKKKPKDTFGHPAPFVPQELLDGCKIVSNRRDILDLLPKNGIGIEVGTFKGEFAKEIVERIQPKKLHLLDIKYSLFNDENIAGFTDYDIEKHEGVSWEVLDSFPDNYFDFGYIDADHSYDSVVKDINAIYPKMKNDSLLLFNDFANWSVFEALPYGVYRAVCEFAVEKQLKFKYLAFEPMGYFDVVLEIKK